MNRIILIGNGFDLAHGMKTSYSHFLNNFWNKQIQEIQASDLNKIDWKLQNEYISLTSPIDRFLIEPKLDSTISPLQSFKMFVQTNKIEVKYKNDFIRIISNKANVQKWIDIENEYYTLLKKTIDFKYPIRYDIIELNKDFAQVKDLLKEYLNKLDKSVRLKPEIDSKIYSLFNLKDFTEQMINQFVKSQSNYINKKIVFIENPSISESQLNKKYQRTIDEFSLAKTKTEQIKQLLLNHKPPQLAELIPEDVLFLNFNYTNTDSLYRGNNSDRNKTTNIEHIQIHGNLNEKHKNPIIFGFGDELDDSYHPIEQLNDNRYLENIKSIKYLETDNYKRLLTFINSNDYQIFVFGHSCGTSDRTLLNTIFEHDNCQSIKPFYYQINKKKDNYSDIVRNISRNFKDKASMRDKVVNKEFCEPLT